MILCIGSILNSEELLEIRNQLDNTDFIDGKRTAGWAARGVKENLQAKRSDPATAAALAKIAERITANATFSLAVRPKAISPLILSRYEPGMQYGTHVDDALMNGLRTDVSFTLFLSEPDTYEGGALVIETTEGENDIKLAAGSLVAYPSTTLHRVEPVSAGVRVAAVGWARSLFRSAEQRELLFDLETARRSLFERDGRNREFQLLSKTAANLARMWADD